jgi:pimeloyl-ACP methyl ester carboxylesterase
MSQLSAALCDHVRLVLFENASHWVQHEEIDEANKLMIELTREGD